MRRATGLLRFIPAVNACSYTVRPATFAEALASISGPSKAYATIPAGHRSSNLSQEICNIGLNRRRDLTLRGDIKVSTTEGPQRLSTLLKVIVKLIGGVPR